MKKLLKAFTLAEILITIGIVGVVARLTLPALTQNVLEQTAASSLGKAINTLELVNEKILLDGNSRSLGYALRLNKTNPSGREYLSALPNYLNGTYRNKRVNLNGANSNRDTFTTKDGIMFVDKSHSWGGIANRPKYSNASGQGYVIDINGQKGPNKYGKDQFVVIIDDMEQ